MLLPGMSSPGKKSAADNTTPVHPNRLTAADYRIGKTYEYSATLEAGVRVIEAFSRGQVELLGHLFSLPPCDPRREQYVLAVRLDPPITWKGHDEDILQSPNVDQVAQLLEKAFRTGARMASTRRPLIVPTYDKDRLCNGMFFLFHSPAPTNIKAYLFQAGHPVDTGANEIIDCQNRLESQLPNITRKFHTLCRNSFLDQQSLSHAERLVEKDPRNSIARH